MTAADEYRMVPVPVPPFTDTADRDASLGAVLVYITHIITEKWARPEAVRQAIDLLAGDTYSDTGADA